MCELKVSSCVLYGLLGDVDSESCLVWGLGAKCHLVHTATGQFSAESAVDK